MATGAGTRPAGGVPAVINPGLSIENYPTYVIGLNPTSTLLRAWSLSEGEAIAIDVTISFPRGTGASVTSFSMRLLLAAHRPTGGGAVVPSPAITISGQTPNVTASWVANGNNAELRFRQTGSSAASPATLSFTIVRDTP